jgi:L,D-peptidoglycan transpeptidase YkuD (ErfK/YbiS/YcfS/YnhG family)
MRVPAFAVVLLSRAFAGELDGARQLIVGIAPTWDSPHGRLQLFERAGDGWKAVAPAWPVLFGKNGLVWGHGLLGTNEPGTHKREHDWRAPAGVFRIGTIYTYDAALPGGAKYPFHTVGAGDAWVDDVNSPDYNRHVTVDPANPPPWFEKQKMRHGDFAYRWLVEIRHNSDPPVPGEGSAIFFHIRRGVSRPSAGCTTMAEENLVKLIRWLRADQHPHYALLPRAEYEAKWKAWGLPSPQAAADLEP